MVPGLAFEKLLFKPERNIPGLLQIKRNSKRYYSNNIFNDIVLLHESLNITFFYKAGVFLCQSVAN